MLNRLKIIKIAFSIAALLSLGGCATVYNPATGRNELIFIDTPSEVALGRDMEKQINRELRLLEDPGMQSRLDAIGRRVALASDRQDLKYSFKIVKADEFNAFAIPGGFVYVNSGLIKNADDDELSGVIGHELGHIAARHSVKRLQANLGYQLIMDIASGASDKKEVFQAVDMTFNLVALGFSRQDEFLADKLAVKYSSGAGYNPRGIVSFFKKLEKEAKPGAQLVFLSSHPPVSERIERVEKEIASKR